MPAEGGIIAKMDAGKCSISRRLITSETGNPTVQYCTAWETLKLSSSSLEDEPFCFELTIFASFGTRR